MREELELGFHPEPFQGEEALQAQLSATLSSTDIGLAVAVLVKTFSPEGSAAGVGSSSAEEGRRTEGGREGGDSGTFEARANAAAARLEGFVVVFVTELRSRFLRLEGREGEGGAGISGEEDITAVNGAKGSLFFVREVREGVHTVGREWRGEWLGHWLFWIFEGERYLLEFTSLCYITRMNSVISTD